MFIALKTNWPGWTLWSWLKCIILWIISHSNFCKKLLNSELYEWLHWLNYIFDFLLSRKVVKQLSIWRIITWNHQKYLSSVHVSIMWSAKIPSIKSVGSPFFFIFGNTNLFLELNWWLNQLNPWNIILK